MGRYLKIWIEDEDEPLAKEDIEIAEANVKTVTFSRTIKANGENVFISLGADVDSSQSEDMLTKTVRFLYQRTAYYLQRAKIAISKETTLGAQTRGGPR